MFNLGFSFYSTLTYLIGATLIILLLFAQMAHVALAFEVPGGWLAERDATIMTVMQVEFPSCYLMCHPFYDRYSLIHEYSYTTMPLCRH
jgi:hypothetical protein